MESAAGNEYFYSEDLEPIASNEELVETTSYSKKRSFIA